MANKNLVTTSGLQEIKIAESTLVNNLIEHANASLSKAHGWEFVYTPVPFLDADGNDLSYYADSHGDLVGSRMLRLSYNDTNYYAPINSSALAGQTAYSGVPLSSANAIATQIEDGTAWLTEISEQNLQNIIATNDAVLLPHSRSAHWQVHTGNVYSVIPMHIFDSAGHTVSNYVARISYAGKELWIPCQPRQGGPVQPIRVPKPALAVSPGTSYNFWRMTADDESGGQYCTFYYYISGGTLPYTIRWQFNTYGKEKRESDPNLGSGTWVDLPYATTATALPASNPEDGYYYMSLPNKLTLLTEAGHDACTIAATIRILFTNAAGTTGSNWCVFSAGDEDGFGFISGPDVEIKASYYPLANDPIWTDGYYPVT